MLHTDYRDVLGTSYEKLMSIPEKNSYLFTMSLRKVINKTTHMGQGNKRTGTSMPQLGVYSLPGP